MRVIGMDRVTRDLPIHGSRFSPVAQPVASQGHQHRAGGYIDVGLGVELEAVRRYERNECIKILFDITNLLF